MTNWWLCRQPFIPCLRLGDTVAAAVFEVLDVWLRLGQGGVAMAGVVGCTLWAAWAWRLGTRQRVMASSLHHQGTTLNP